MRELTNREVDVVSGGICEGLSIAECLQGAAQQLMEELGIFWGGVSRSELVRMLNRAGGDIGIWLYNATHEDEFKGS